MAPIVAVGLTLAAPCRLLAEEPPGREWMGQRVLPKHRQFTLRDAEDGGVRAAKVSIYRVEEVKGDALWLTPPVGPSGWGEIAAVVPIEEAVEFFSDAIGTSPQDPHNYAMRAIVLLFERDDPVHALADCEKAIRLDPNYAFARGVRGESGRPPRTSKAQSPISARSSVSSQRKLTHTAIGG